MKCQTILKYNELGIPSYKSKKQYDCLEDAIKEARFINSRKTTISKVVPYKCPDCSKFHLGRNGSLLTEKQRTKNVFLRKLKL